MKLAVVEAIGGAIIKLSARSKSATLASKAALASVATSLAKAFDSGLAEDLNRVKNNALTQQDAHTSVQVQAAVLAHNEALLKGAEVQMKLAEVERYQVETEQLKSKSDRDRIVAAQEIEDRLWAKLAELHKKGFVLYVKPKAQIETETDTAVQLPNKQPQTLEETIKVLDAHYFEAALKLEDALTALDELDALDALKFRIRDTE